MKRQRTPAQLAAAQAARGRYGFALLLGFLVGLAVFVLSGEFILVHCVVAAGVAASGGLMLARVVAPIDPAGLRSAGARGGMVAALGYVAPFTVAAVYNYATLTSEKAAVLLAELSSSQLAQARQFLISPGSDALEYFRGQYISYVFGYLLAALFVGWIFGVVGAGIARARGR